MTLIQMLKALDVNREVIDDLLVLHMQARQLRNEYTEANIDVPEWLDGAIGLLSKEIERQSQDRLALRLKELDRAEAGLLTNTEKRERLQQERNKILARMGKAPETTPAV